jgi:uncharacterized protein (TIGR02996 family)
VADKDVRRLYAAVYAAPDDDAPRAVLADLLQERDDPRGELIALQLAKKNKPRQAELLRRFGHEWAGGLDDILYAKGRVWRRGFLAEGVTKYVGDDALLDLPEWATLEKLRLRQGLLPRSARALRHVEGVTGETLRALVDSALRPRVLVMKSSFDDAQAWKAFAASPAASALERATGVPDRFKTAPVVDATIGHVGQLTWTPRGIVGLLAGGYGVPETAVAVFDPQSGRVLARHETGRLPSCTVSSDGANIRLGENRGMDPLTGADVKVARPREITSEVEERERDDRGALGIKGYEIWIVEGKGKPRQLAVVDGLWEARLVGDRVVASSSDDLLSVFDRAGKRLAKLRITGGPTCLPSAVHGECVVFATDTGLYQLSVGGKAKLTKLAGGKHYAVAFSPDGKLLAVSQPKKLSVQDLAGKVRWSVKLTPEW